MHTCSSLSRLAILLLLITGLAACDSADDDGGGNGSDSMPPVLLSATFSGQTVTANFSEALDPQTVTPSAFTISPGVAVVSASASGAQAFLTTATALDDDTAYTLTVNGVGDTSGNVSATSTTPLTESGGTGGGGGGNASQEIGAAYPNAADARIVLFNTDGDRFLLFNPVTGVASDADDLNDVENGLIPLDNVGAAATLSGDNETYFFSTDGDTFTNYERENAEFDPPASFEAEYDEFGYELTSVGAAVDGGFFASNSMILFNGNGTQWQLWQPGAGGGGSDVFSDVFSYPDGFGSGSPISAVGAAFFDASGPRIFLFNREGTQYTIWRGNNNFTEAFDISELGDIRF